MKKRICFLTDSIFSVGGVQRVTAVIAKELAKEHDITIVTFDAQEMQDTTLYGLDEVDITYRFFRYPAVGKIRNIVCKAYSAFYKAIRPSGRLFSDLYANSSFPAPRRKELACQLTEENYDIIIGVHAPLAARLATLRPLLNKNVCCIGWIHNSFEALFGPTSLYIGPVLKRHYVCQFKKLDNTVVLCQHDADSYYTYDATFHPTVIYNPLTLVPGTPSKGTTKRFLAVGRFSHLHKGFDLLIDAFHIFAQEDSEWTLDIVGEGPEESLYRDKISEYHLEQRVLLHPFTNRVQDYYSQAQVYVLSSRWEGFGLVLVEAMAHGLPVVSSNLPTSLEIMGDFGIYFENGNVEQLAQRLQEATQMDWPSKSAEALSVASRFNVDHIISQWKEIL
ncbi:MAG: glycosyltransferase family 4 protein [Prevotella sp.]|nr:glycosyltransferase family 4 protein [Prevotella sp.]